MESTYPTHCPYCKQPYSPPPFLDNDERVHINCLRCGLRGCRSCVSARNCCNMRILKN